MWLSIGRLNYVKCTPDLSGLKCTQCLFGAISYIPNYCAGKIRARIFKPSCNLRFDTIPYYDPMIDVLPSLTPQAFPSPPSSTTTTFKKADDEIKPTETLQLDFQTIIDATNNFLNANKLVQGGFGLVYKGRLPNGEEIAIKRLSRDSG
ncbi:hypothetical protein VNO77_41093 [Canavalia gladiata]|uniref:Gnk2-homologous domain-containing protein n=1 Tax=Canavalia gladiata TaxID=3824 RepID=A0AAN9JZ16_CANGL